MGGPPDLSQVDPAVLMSAAGRSEYEGARQLTAASDLSFQRAARQLRGRTEDVAFLDDAQTFTASQELAPPTADRPSNDDGIGFDLDGDWTGDWEGPQRHNARVASVARQVDSIDLAAMWMQGTGIPFDRSQLVAEGGDGFEFDTGDFVVDASTRGGGGGGGSAQRFRVDAPPPPRPAFNRALVNDQGPMTEAGRVRNGRFPILRETGPGAYQRPPVPPAFIERMERPYEPPPPPSAPRGTAIQQARAMQAKARGPSVYDLIRSDPLRSK